MNKILHILSLKSETPMKTASVRILSFVNKRIRLVVLLLVANISFIWSQTLPQYTFSASSGAYTSINPTAATPTWGNADEGAYNGINIGFTFNYCGTAYTTVSASTNGWLTFGQDIISNAYYTNDLTYGGVRPLLAPLWDDLQFNGAFYYQTTGTAPNRIFTAQWGVMRWDYSTNNNVISFQIKLYETTNVINFVYNRENKAPSATASASIGITDGSTGPGSFWSLNGTGTNPTASSSIETSDLNARPASGQVYTFTPPSTITYYSQGSGDPNVLTNWKTSGGTSPTSFALANQIFIIKNGHTMTTTASGWSVSGSNTMVEVQNGGTLTETSAITFSANTTLQVDDGGTLNHNVNSLSIFGGTESFGNASTVNYGLAGAQTILAATYGNLTISGSGNKTLQGTTTVNGNLTLTSGTLAVAGNTLTLNGPAIAGTPSNLSTTSASTLVFGGPSTGITVPSSVATLSNLTVSNANGITLAGPLSANTLTFTNGILNTTATNLVTITGTSTGSIGGASATSYINGPLARTLLASQTNYGTPYLFPVGDGSNYRPLELLNVTTGTTSPVIVVSENSTGALNSDETTITSIAPRNWSMQSISGNFTSALVRLTENGLDFTKKIGQSASQAGNYASVGGNGIGTTITTASAIANATLPAYFAIGNSVKKTYYSYQSGDWNSANTWTIDPSGSLWIGAGIPTAADNVVILNGRTVKINEDGKSCYSLEIKLGGNLDLQTYISHNFGSVIGQGTLKLSSNTFPGGTYDDFVAPDGGTVEYYNLNNTNISTTQLTYNNLIVSNYSTSANMVYIDNATSPVYVLNGNFNLNNNSTGSLTFYFGRPTASDNLINMTVYGNFTVSAGSNIRVNNFASNNHSFVGSATMPAYPAHTLNIYGDLTNNGSIRFTGLPSPAINAYYILTNNQYGGINYGDVQVFFKGASDNTLTCNGVTDFFRLIVEKGTDQTYTLEVNSSNTNNFALYGPNYQGSQTKSGGSSGKGWGIDYKALFLHYGTLKLNANINIPSLTEGGLDFNIIPTAALWVNGAIIHTTVTNFYATTNDNNGAYQTTTLCGRLQISAGEFNTGDATGIVLSDFGTPEFILEGTGILDVSQFWVTTTGANKISYTQTGGTANIRLGGQNQGATPMMDLSNTSTVFVMSGGTINFKSNTYLGGGTNYNTMNIGCQAGNYKVTGGTINFNLPGSTTSYTASSTVPLYNVNITRNGGTGPTTTIQWGTPGPLKVLNDLNIGANSALNLGTNSIDLNVGGDFTIDNAGTYNAGTNTTTFNGAGGQSFLNGGTITGGTGGLNNLVITGNSNTDIATNNLIIRGALTIDPGCFLNDVGHYISVAGNVTNSGTHTSQGIGAIILNGTTAQSIGGSDYGVFGNLTLSKGGGLASLTANQTITGNLRLVTGILDINTHNLKLSAGSNIYDLASGTATPTTFGNTKMITTAGQQSDGGLTKTFSAIGSFLYPVGTGTAYHPGTIVISQAPATWGDVTVRPVAKAHPFARTGNQVLAYYWKVTSNSITGIQPGSVSHTYHYVAADAGTQLNTYITGVYNPFAWTSGATAQVDKIASNILFPSVNILDGDYTAGVPAAFASVKVFYSRQSGPWETYTTWSNISNSGAAIGSTDPLPSAGDVVVIGDGGSNNHVVTITANTKTVGGLQISKGSTLDIRTFNTLNFGALPDLKVVGTGTLRIASSYFPSGDFGNFLGPNGGTVEYYTETAPNNIGAAFTLPTQYSSGTTINITNYCNLKLSPATGKNITLPDADLLIYNNFTDSVSGTSATGIAQFNNQATSRTLTINGNLNVSKGNLQYTNNTAQNVIVNGDVNVASGAILDVTAANGATNTLSIQGNLTNNGTFDMIAGAAQICNVTFTGLANKKIMGTTAVRTDFNILTVNKGTDRNSILEATVNALSLNTNISTALTLTNGTFRLSSPAASPITITLTTSNSFTIPSTGCLSANVGTINIGSANGNYDLFLRGRLEVMNAGKVNIGNGSGTDNDIEYAAAGNPEINVSGGTLNVDGRIRRSTTNTLGSLWFNQSGGTITVKGNGANVTRGMFEVLNTGSQFNVSGGNLIIENAGSTSVADVYIDPETSTVNNSNGGHTLTIGDGATPAAEVFNLNTSAPLWNLTIDGTTNNKSASLSVNKLSVLHKLTINGNGTAGTGSVFKANELSVIIGDSLVNNNLSSSQGADQGGYQAGAAGSTQSTTFTGTGKIVGSGSNLTNFANLIIGSASSTPSITLGTNSNIRVNNNLTLTSGTLADAGNTITVLGDISNSAVHSSPLVPGGGIVLSNGTQQVLSGSGSGRYGNITISNPSGVNMICNNTITGQLNLSGGLVYIDDYKLTMDVNASFGGTFNASHMVVSNGVLSDAGVQKLFSGSATNFIFPVGSPGKYRPATFTFSSPNAGSLRVVPVASAHAADHSPTNDQLNYYWRTWTTGFSGLTSSTQIYQYSTADIVGTESSYRGAYYYNYTWRDDGASVINTTAHTITETRSDLLSGEYTAGEVANFSNMPPLYSTGTGPWSSGNSWSVNPSGTPTYGTAPNGNPVFIQSGHTITMDVTTGAFAYSVDIVGTLDLGTTTFHNLGFITDTTHKGTGRLMIQATSDGMFTFPGGNYDAFMASPGTTVELYGNTDATLPLKPGNIYKPYQNLDLTGTGVKYMSAENLKISGNLTINNGAKLNNTLFSKSLYILGNWTDKNSGTSGFVPGSGLVSFEGSSAQNLTMSNPLTENFYNLRMNNSAGLTLKGAINGNIQVANILTLTNGPITTNSNNSLTITNASPAAFIGGSAASFVNGPLKKQISNGSFFNFPVGKTGTPSRYGNVYISSIVNAGVWEAEYYNDDPTNHVPSFDITKKKLPISHVSNNEYWRINGVTGGSGNVRLRWDANSGYAGSSSVTRSKIRVVEWNPSGTPSAQWEYKGKVLNDGGDISGTVTTDNIISLAPGTDKHYLTIGDEGLPTATITSPLAASICNNATDPTTITVALTGTPPWSLSYKLGSVTTTLNNIASSPVSIILTSASPGITGVGTFNFNITNVNDLTGTPGITDYVTTVAVTVKATPANTITGRTAVGTGETGVVYSTPGDASTYLWSLPSGGTITSGANTSSCTITWGSTVGSYTLSLTKTSNGCSVTNSILVNTSATPTPVITGNQYVCAGSTQIYSTPAVSGHSFTWSLIPAGAGTISGTGNSISVIWNSEATGNSVNVREFVTATPAIYTDATLPVDIGMQPSATTPTYSAPSAVCNGNTAAITVNGSESGVSYQLKLVPPANTNVGSPVAGNSGPITLTTPALSSSTDYNIRAFTLDPYNCSAQLSKPASTFTINTSSVPSVTNAATASTCSGTGPNISLTASVPSNFAWTIGTITGSITGASAGSGSTINQVLTNPSNTTAGTVQYLVTPTSTTGSCAGAAYTITVTVNPAPTVTTAATASTCSGTGPNISLTASLPSNFAWTIGTITGSITGASAGSGSTINQVLTNPSNTTAGTVQYLVIPTATTGSCAGAAYTITVTVNPAPGQPAAFTASTNVLCQGTNNVIYTVPNDATVTYTWSYTVGTGATITGTTNSVSVNYSNTATSGTLNVYATNGCGTSTARTLGITVNPLPTTGPVYRKPNN